MQGKIDEDIDAVGADDLGDFGVVRRPEIPPAVRFGTKGRGDGIGLENIGITKDFEARLISLPEERKQAGADNMIAEIR